MGFYTHQNYTFMLVHNEWIMTCILSDDVITCGGFCFTIDVEVEFTQKLFPLNASLYCMRDRAVV